MKSFGSPSLKRHLIGRLILYYVSVLFLFGLAFVAFLVRADMGGVLVDPAVTEVAARAIERRPDGRLVVTETDELRALHKAAPQLWFVARHQDGRIVSYGDVPATYAEMAGQLDRVSFADIRDTLAPYQLSAVIRHAYGPAGKFTVLGKGQLFSLTFVVLFLSNLLMIPILLLLALVTVIVIPWIVRGALSGLSRVAAEAERIDVSRRGDRLPDAQIPAEIVPLVRAVNGALQRLDEGYERHQRFIVDAAHELRTPIAILQARVEGLDSSPGTERVRRDIVRLATLAEQLLDLQRLDRDMVLERGVDLLSIAQRVAADLAPILIANGCEVEVADEQALPVTGDPAAIERMLTNLVQNAIEHGGKHVILRVTGAALEVEDDGPGIPAEARSQIFEPFFRLRARATGAGLGLNLVRQMMDRHQGTIAVEDAPDGGTIMRLRFPES